MENTQGQAFLVKAIDSYKPKKGAKDHLALKKGQVITVLETDDQGYRYYGTSGSKKGWFPYIYVKSTGMTISSAQLSQTHSRPATRSRANTAAGGGVNICGKDKRYVLKAGMLYCRDQEKRAEWKKRWVVLRVEDISFYRSAMETTKRPIFASKVKDIESIDIEIGQTQHEFCFKLQTKKKCLILSADATQERKEWIAMAEFAKGGCIGEMPGSETEKENTTATTQANSTTKEEIKTDQSEQEEKGEEQNKKGDKAKDKSKPKKRKKKKSSAADEHTNNDEKEKETETEIEAETETETKIEAETEKQKETENESESTKTAVSTVIEQTQDSAAQQSSSMRDLMSIVADMSASNLGIGNDERKRSRSISGKGAAPKGMQKVRAKFDYVGRSVTELTFRANEEFYLIEKKANGWWYGATPSGSVGHFPPAFVEIIEDFVEESPKLAAFKQRTAVHKTSSVPPQNTQQQQEQKKPTPSPIKNQVETKKEKRKKEKIVIDNRYSLGDQIGKGAFGTVYKGLDLTTGGMVAVKQVALDLVDKKELANTMAELDLLKELNHINIVNYVGFAKTPEHLNVVLEYVEGGSLAVIIKKFGTIQEQLVVRYVNQILEGLKYLHSKQVVHRDIKCGNILITKEGVVKLADFGIATKLGDTAAENQGSPFWMAPEIIKFEPSTPAADIWSLGCTIIELITGDPPYFELNSMQAMFKIVEDEEGPTIPDDVSPRMASFLKQCFQKNPTERPTAVQLLEHPLLSGKAEEEEEEEEEEEDEAELELARWTKQLNELINWLQQAMEKENVSHAIRFRTAVRKKFIELIEAHESKDPLYKPLFTKTRAVIRECEDKFGEYLPIDDDDIDIYSDDDYDSDEFEDEEEFQF